MKVLKSLVVVLSFVFSFGVALAGSTTGGSVCKTLKTQDKCSANTHCSWTTTQNKCTAKAAAPKKEAKATTDTGTTDTHEEDAHEEAEGEY